MKEFIFVVGDNDILGTMHKHYRLAWGHIVSVSYCI